ncbi:hypothetical protein ACHHYP_17369 [Achlya hypogyna]|uniref:Uncharacterized protein n=1 Tax=Achlya hypogyna TaxID=1202772 RepID=A0A1V9Y4L8_ACHHY|nr:hypothetical protein ACHHYP_17369 [Achlya hypogyna]
MVSWVPCCRSTPRPSAALAVLTTLDLVRVLASFQAGATRRLLALRRQIRAVRLTNFIANQQLPCPSRRLPWSAFFLAFHRQMVASPGIDLTSLRAPAHALAYALVVGDVPAVAALLPAATDIEHIQWSVAATHGHVHVLQYLLVHDRGHCTADTMRAAAWSGHGAVVRFLLTHSIGAKDLLHYACMGGRLALVQHAWRLAPAVTPATIVAAAALGRLPVLRFLLARATDSFSPEATDAAAAAGHLAVVQMLHRLGHHGHHALYQAATHGHVDVVAFLEAVASDEDVATSVYGAARCGQLTVVEYFLAHRPATVVLSELELAANEGAKGAATADCRAIAALVKRMRYAEAIASECCLQVVAPLRPMGCWSMLPWTGRCGPGYSQKVLGSAQLRTLRVSMPPSLHPLRSPDLVVAIAAFQPGYSQRTIALVRALRVVPLRQPARLAVALGPFHVRYAVWFRRFGARGLDELCANGFSDHLVVYALAFSNVELLTALHARGRLGTVDWEACAAYAHLSVFQFLFDAGLGTKCPASVLGTAAATGNLQLVRFLHHRGAPIPSDALKVACNSGHIKVAEYCLQYGLGHWDRSTVVVAILHGRTNVIQFLHRHNYQGFSAATMDLAAQHGKLEIVAFLHKHRQEGCSARALESAAGNGHVGVVRFLDTYRREGSVVVALEAAAAKGHVAVVRYLLVERRVTMDKTIARVLLASCKHPAVVAVAKTSGILC